MSQSADHVKGTKEFDRIYPMLKPGSPERRMVDSSLDKLKLIMVQEVKIEGLPPTIDAKVVPVRNVLEAKYEWNVVFLGYRDPRVHSRRGLPAGIMKPQARPSEPCANLNSRSDSR